MTAVLANLNEDPEFRVQPCDCGGRCGTLLFVMVHPHIREVESAKLAATVQFPITCLEGPTGLIALLRKLAREAKR